MLESEIERLRKECHEILDKKTNGRLSQFLVEEDLCPICWQELVMRKGEKICLICGFSKQLLNFVSRMEMGETRQQMNELRWGRGLGDTLGRIGMFTVIATGNTGREPDYEGTDNLPIRMPHLTTIVKTYEHPKIRRMLWYGRMRMIEWKLDDRDNKKHDVAKNYLGILTRKVGAYYVMSKMRVPVQKTVDALFLLMLLRIFGVDKFEESWEKLKMDSQFYESVEEIVYAFTIARKPDD